MSLSKNGTDEISALALSYGQKVQQPGKKGRIVMKLEGSVALVTGANRGLGKALVAALVEAGAAKVYALTSYNVLASSQADLDADFRTNVHGTLAVIRAFQTSPADTARGVLAGIARGDEEIFPDPMAQQMGALWNKSHKEVERAFASF